MNLLNITLPSSLFIVQDKLAMKVFTELTCPKLYFRSREHIASVNFPVEQFSAHGNFYHLV